MKTKTFDIEGSLLAHGEEPPHPQLYVHTIIYEIDKNEANFYIVKISSFPPLPPICHICPQVRWC